MHGPGWVVVLVSVGLIGCAEQAPAATADVSPDSGGGSYACEGSALFGLPNSKTGLTASECGPTCSCGGSAWTPAPWTAERLTALRAWKLVVPYAEVSADPYAAVPPPEAPTGTVCAVHTLGKQEYQLETHPNAAAALAAGAVPSHDGACGVCSTLHDLAVYAEKPDLTDPVRQCGLNHLGGEMADHVQCLLDLGFTLPCAQIWYWNTLHTRTICSQPCFATLGSSYHLPDGSLNACLTCDEVNSGPVFKAIAGRNRRNTGVPSSMCRPCSEVTRYDHDYGGGK